MDNRKLSSTSLDDNSASSFDLNILNGSSNGKFVSIQQLVPKRDELEIKESDVTISFNESTSSSPTLTPNTTPMTSPLGKLPLTILEFSQEEKDIIFNDAVTKFNLKPKSTKDFLVSKRIIGGTAQEIAHFIFTQPKLSKRRVGEYIGQLDTFNQRVCEALFAMYQLSAMSLDNALRMLTRQFRLPGEAQQIDRILEKFAISYHNQNPGVFLSSDTAYVLSHRTVRAQ